MALEFIPNQPILFTPPILAGQSCLNNDTRQYAQLAQQDDTTCIQWKNNLTPLFDCGMNNLPNVITNGKFNTLLTGWQEIIVTTTTVTPVTHYSYNGTGCVSTGTPGSALFTPTGLPIGSLIHLSFYVSDPTIQISAGLTNSSTGTVNFDVNCSINSDGRVSLVLSGSNGTDIFMFSNGPVEFRDVVVHDLTSNFCFVPNTPSLDWSYVESVNGYEYTGGVFNSPLTMNATLVTGKSYQWKFSIKDLPIVPSNYIQIVDDTTSAVIFTATENKDYNFYYTHTGANTTFSIVLSNYSAAIRGVTVYDMRIDEVSFNYRARIEYANGGCASINYDSTSLINYLQFYEDRIVWCFQWDTLINCENPFVGLDTGCYKVVIDDIDAGQTFTSYTVINYTTGVHECSVISYGSCSGEAFGFIFNSQDSNFYFVLTQRLRVLQFNPKYPNKTEQYLYSNGYNIRTYAETGKLRTAWFDYVDEPTHDVIRIQLLCDNFILDNRPYFYVSEDYEPEWGQNGKYNLAQSRVTLMSENEPTLFNKSC